MTGTPAEWEAWAGPGHAQHGDHILPGGLAPLHLDRDTDGVYTEPGIWVQHQ